MPLHLFGIKKGLLSEPFFCCPKNCPVVRPSNYSRFSITTIAVQYVEANTGDNATFKQYAG